MTACAISRKRLLRSNVSMALYVSKKFFPQRGSWDEMWIFRGALKKHPPIGGHNFMSNCIGRYK
jgi:hypothetical protein